MSLPTLLLGFALGSVPFAAWSLSQPTPNPEEPTFARDVKPVLDRYCLPCHSGEAALAGLDLARYRDADSVVTDPRRWERIAQHVKSGHMPPPGLPRPTDTESERFVSWIERTLADNDCGLRDAGRVTIRRLNRTEYDNTIRDLVGIDYQPGRDFPSDDVGYGFDNIGDVLTISPLLMERYLAAAEEIARRAIVVPLPRERRIAGPELEAEGAGTSQQGGTQGLFSAGEAFTRLPVDGGRYHIRVRAHADQAGPELARMEFRVDQRRVGVIEVPAVAREPGTYSLTVDLSPGTRRIGAAFVNDYYNPSDPDPNNRDRNLYVHWIEVVGPIGDRMLPESHIRLIPETPSSENEASAAREYLGRFARRAYRRPVLPEEVERLGSLYDRVRRDMGSFEWGMRAGVMAILASPHFIFRVETDPNPARGRDLNSHELASRLSYFLWASMPDDRLFELADDGTLTQPEVLRAEVRRMLADPKAVSLAEDFGSQWLQLPRLDLATPDPDLYPGVDSALRQAMRTETLLFLRDIMRRDGSVLEFVDARFTYLNGPLARHYGIEGIEGDQFRRVELTDERRGGLLTQAGILTFTSNPNRTSPVKRGKWILEQILGTPPPPPPPGVPDLSEERSKIEGKTIRERMEQHRSDPMCASCHIRMDALGFGLENFDGVGRWRETDEGQPIDASGELAAGIEFDGPAGLRRAILAQQDLYLRNLAGKTLTYALGRGLTEADNCFLEEITEALKQHDFRFSALIEAVVLTEAFRSRGTSQGHGSTARRPS